MIFIHLLPSIPMLQELYRQHRGTLPGSDQDIEDWKACTISEYAEQNCD
ncbi:hypothetical protein [Porphyromonas circumdentaria]|nr:hypothetical protein [Porphyromonas circumdentaria]MBB6275067.1 hypothetical protein [Porphyromonas circumdentaria]